MNRFTYFQNIGTRAAAQYARGVRLGTEDCAVLEMDMQMITPVAVDWEGDGDPDLICGEEKGRIALIENAGRPKDGMPLFRKPAYFRQEADGLKCGAPATPFAVDWDGDGDWDILCGNSAGYIVFFENLSGPGRNVPSGQRRYPSRPPARRFASRPARTVPSRDPGRPVSATPS